MKQFFIFVNISYAYIYEKEKLLPMAQNERGMSRSGSVTSPQFFRCSSATTSKPKMHIRIKRERPRKLSSLWLDNLHTFSVTYCAATSCTIVQSRLNNSFFIFGMKFQIFLKSHKCSAMLAHIALSGCCALNLWFLATSSANVTGS